MLSSGTLLATIPANEVDRVALQLSGQGIQSAVIGKVTSPDSGFHLVEDNRSIELPMFQTDEVTRALSARA